MAPAGVVSVVAPSSPAHEAGLCSGCAIAAVDGHPIFDIIDWRWYSAEACIALDYTTPEGSSKQALLEREEGQDWGIEFSEALFDGTRQCVNACTFCFMKQLPQDSRESLLLRDDDFRLSFLQGTFVTFTNLTQSDVDRIIQQHLSPLRFSLHAIDPSLRESIMGKHAQKGIEVAEKLLAAGIQLHAQIVLMPGINDGAALQRTLEWAYQQENILTVGIVPVGYTKHQSAFDKSFNKRSDSQAVLQLIQPFQERALAQRGQAWVHASDEFYRNAFPDSLLQNLPPASYYGNFDLFEDGIGIVRNFVDDFVASAAQLDACAQAIAASGKRVLFVCGCAQKEFFTPLLETSACCNYLVPLYVENNYFGGNVDVTGLLCACDIAPAINSYCAQHAGSYIAVIPRVIFNADGVTLDEVPFAELASQLVCPAFMVSCQASEFLPEIAELVSLQKGASNG